MGRSRKERKKRRENHSGRKVFLLQSHLFRELALSKKVCVPSADSQLANYFKVPFKNIQYTGRLSTPRYCSQEAKITCHPGAGTCYPGTGKHTDVFFIRSILCAKTIQGLSNGVSWSLVDHQFGALQRRGLNHVSFLLTSTLYRLSPLRITNGHITYAAPGKLQLRSCSFFLST